MFGLPGGWEWVLILLIGLLLFGRRLPEVGRSLGQSIVEFKKGVKGVQDEIEDASDEPRHRSEPRRRPELHGQSSQYGAGMVEPEKVAPVGESGSGDERRVSRDDAV
ncbi:MAG: twin-arginine translocase TatA/TatE family subunit [Phycisphaerales bacterium]|nr:twin-arginine translocase TatA/TatE family subunit [Phycisphaerales bacterium]